MLVAIKMPTTPATRQPMTAKPNAVAPLEAWVEARVSLLFP